MLTHKEFAVEEEVEEEVEDWKCLVRPGHWTAVCCKICGE
jgi:hypothetical protein